MFHYSLGDNVELRLLQPHHADELFALIVANRAYLREWVPWVDDARTVEAVQAFCRKALHESTEDGHPTAGIWLAEELAGVISLHAINWNDRNTSIGYWLGAAFQGRGLMTRACRAMVDYALVEQRLHRVEISVATGNIRSRAIPERLGFTHEGRLRQAQFLYDHYVDLEMYAMLRDEWHG